jgi:hypothetical protein
MVNPVGAAGGPLPPPVPAPTKLVTLEAGSVAVKLPPDTGRFDCCARSSEADVVHGVTVLAVRPFKEIVIGVLEAF